MRVELFVASARDADNEAAHPARLVNCYREPVQAGGRTRYAVKSALGLKEYASVDGVMMRALMADSGSVYACCGAALHRIGGAGAGSRLASLPDDEQTTIAANTGQPCIVADGRYFVWTGAALTEPAAGAFSAFGSVDHLGGYTILSEKGGRRLQWSALADPTDLDGLDFASAESTSEPVTRVFAVNDILRVFKPSGVEFWQRTGLAGPDAFEQINGGQRDVGLRGFNLICRLPDGAFFVGSDGRVYITAGLEQTVVSTPAVETAVEYGEPLRCVYWQDEGHGMCAIVFGRSAAWVYDTATGEWHERTSASDGPWRAAATVAYGGRWLCGLDTGAVAQFARVNRDLGAPLIRTARSRPIELPPGNSVSMLRIHGRVGVERDLSVSILDASGEPEAVLTGIKQSVLATGTPAGPPKVVVRLSRDGGFTWFRSREFDTGARGEYLRRIEMHALGQFREPMVVEAVMSSVAETPIYSDADIEVA